MDDWHHNCKVGIDRSASSLVSNMPSKATRREALRKILLISAGTCVALFGVSEIIGSISKLRSQNGSKVTQTKITAMQNETLSTTNTSSPSTAAIAIDRSLAISALSNYTIKVAYFGFQTIETTGVTEEYLALSSPVFLQDVLSQISEEHVVLAAMLPIMAITVNGIPVYGNPQLANNSEVDFIPIYAGG